MSLLSMRARQARDWLLFALASLIPSLAVGWLALRALQGQQDATRREVAVALQAVAERSARSAQDEVDAAMVRLSSVVLPGRNEDLEQTLRDVAPPFSDAVVVTADGQVAYPDIAKPPTSKHPRLPPPAACAKLATDLAKSPSPDLRRRFLGACEESKSVTGRWLWPIIALRNPSGASREKLAVWMEDHASAMRRTEREATLLDAKSATWLVDNPRSRVLRALASSATEHEALEQTLDRREAAAALRRGADATGFIRWKGGGSWGVLRRHPRGGFAGFVIHASSVENAIRAGWPRLSTDYRVSTVTGEGLRVDPRKLVRVASLAPGLGLRIDLADPSLPARQAEHSKTVLITVGASAALLAFAIAALLFARMRAAKRLSELRTGFVSTVSHELRTPITSIRMLAELLEQDRVEPEEMAEVHAALAREAARLGDTVDRLLGFSRMAAGRHVIERTTCSVVDTVAQAIETFEQRHPDNGPVERRVPEHLDAFIDAGQVQLALDNLLENAAKYAPQGTPYRVAVREQGDDVVFEVADHGPGVPRRDRKRLFRPFERGDDRLSTEVQGSGLGLSLVAHVAQAHGGSVEVRDEPGGGARFRMRIPRREA